MFAADPNLIDSPEGKDLMKDAQKYIKEAARLSGYKGETPTIDGSGGGNNNPLINGEQSNNPYEIMKRQTKR